jgi:hypothetical protein
MPPMWNRDLLESVCKNFDINFVIKEFPANKTIHNLVNKLRTGLLIDNKQKHKHWVLTEEKLDDIGARLEYTPENNWNI